MNLSNDNSTWLGPYSFATSYTWNLTPGDGTKTVYAQFYSSTGKYGAIASDTVVLDTVPQGPGQLREVRITDLGCQHHDHFHVGGPLGVTDLGGLSRVPAPDHLDGQLLARVRHRVDDLQ